MCVASFTTFLSVVHDAGGCLAAAFLALGAGAVPSSLLEFHISVWAMLEVWHLLDGVRWLFLMPVTVPLVLGDVEFVPEGA